MKIIAFQIKNYRSIIDSRKCFLSPDYITALIGQNESGKTSVLEALRSFYEGNITDDVLRSDLTFPEIICTFKLDDGKVLADYVDLTAIPEELKPVFRSMSELSVSRKWESTLNSSVALAEEQVVDFFIRLNNIVAENTDKIQSIFPQLELQAEKLTREINDPEMSVSTDNLLAEKKAELQSVAEKLEACRQFRTFLTQENTLKEELGVNISQIKEAQYQLKVCKNNRLARKITKNLEKLNSINAQISTELVHISERVLISRKTACKVLDGLKMTDAEKEAVQEYTIERGYASPEDIGNAVFQHIPIFEFFEDFSSLLPNKIDLDDLFNENNHAEGYKAARNFLRVAGLSGDFFREDNHRILKQKIENLNTEITIDFQDYWRQTVGKNDKIRINFELEHYDYSHPEKSGKPYLEFWVKDKQERLYPKQRSRGVRWFLSFYLELKATAKEKRANRVMLIDEPGLSLHARAQEDVLKVFEDLRESMQIIYCTHSPNLIDLKKLYRIIAVQRAKETDEKSETLIMDARSLNEASADTLSPIYSLMGTRLNDRQFIFPKNNLIVEDSITFHYLDAMAHLYGFKDPVHFIPASGSEQVPLLANIMLGWKIDFTVLLMDNPANAQLITFINSTALYSQRDGNGKRFKVLEGYASVEDLFSTIDFKRFILKQRVGITVKNSEFIDVNSLSRMILVSDFHQKMQADNLQYKDFDDETRANFDKVFGIIQQLLVKD